MGTTTTRNSNDAYTTAVALVRTAQKDYADHQKSGENITVECARATHAAFSAGLVGSKESLYPTVQEYANLFSRIDGSGAVVAMSRSTVTLWRRLGKADSLGVTREAFPKEWARLVQRGNDKRVSSVIDADDATSAKIRKATNAMFDRKGAFVKADSEKASGEPEKGAETGESGTTGVTVPESVPAMLDALETLALRLATGRNLTPVESARLADVLDTLGSITTGKSEDAALAS